jgi:hypothetical protein
MDKKKLHIRRHYLGTATNHKVAFFRDEIKDFVRHALRKTLSSQLAKLGMLHNFRLDTGTTIVVWWILNAPCGGTGVADLHHLTGQPFTIAVIE